MKNKNLVRDIGKKAKARMGQIDGFKGIVENKRVTMAEFWIRQKWYRVMKNNTIGLKIGRWSGCPETRVEAIRFLVERVLRKDPKNVSQKDFRGNMLNGLLAHYFRGSPYLALTGAGYDFRPWELASSPNGFWKAKKNRTDAVFWLVEKLGKGKLIRDISVRDFYSNGLCGLLSEGYCGSPFAALKEAGYDVSPRDMRMPPQKIYCTAAKRARIIREAVKKSGKRPKDMKLSDFRKQGLYGFVNRYYNGSPCRALIAAGYRIKPWMMGHTPSWFLESRKNRIMATKWLAKRAGKKTDRIKSDDFRRHGLRGLLKRYKESACEALYDAGLIGKEGNKGTKNRN